MSLIDFMIGAVVVTHEGDEGMIIDRILSYCNSSNYTTYLLAKSDLTVMEIEAEDIHSIVQLSGGNPIYFKKKNTL
jgi:hypothetical protein